MRETPDYRLRRHHPPASICGSCDEFLHGSAMVQMLNANGGPEVMRWEEIALPLPAAGEARVRHTAIGINYSDLNVRRGGFYLARPLRFPVVLGNEAAGVVESVGEGVTEVEIGDRVAYEKLLHDCMPLIKRVARGQGRAL